MATLDRTLNVLGVLKQSICSQNPCRDDNTNNAHASLQSRDTSQENDKISR